MRARMRHRLAVAAGHSQPFNRACSVHVASALLIELLVVLQLQKKQVRRAFPRIRASTHPGLVNDKG